MKQLLVLTFCSLVSQFLFGGEERYINFINGSDIEVDAVLELNDPKFYLIEALPGWEYEFTNHSVQNKVILEFDKNNPQLFLTDFTTEVKVLIEYTDENLDDHAVTKTLTLEYFLDPSLTIEDRSTFIFTGGHDVKITILSITGYHAVNLQLRTEMFIERYYTFNHTAVPTELSYNYTSGNEFIEVYWTPINGAEEYELEFVHINDYTKTIDVYESTSNLNYNYYRNSTRISTGETFYKIPSIFDHGYVVFRVRGISRQGANYDKRYEGDWTADESGTIASHPVAQVIPITTEYEDGLLNWSHSVIYTDFGNRQDQVGFMDGLSRPRQSVLSNPVTDQVIVQNVYYDYHGRVGVTDLSTPVNEGELVFYPEFNLNEDENVYNAENFDLDYDGPICPTAVDPMIALSGAARYYSPDNPDKEGAQAYVPDAEGYPFRRIEYTPDFTGRVRRAGGYGPDYQLESGHETKFLYATPFSGDLSNMFGEEVGNYKKYSKIVTSDANGQSYVTYKNFEGQVIATALIGVAPESLETLDNNVGAMPFGTTIIDGPEGQDLDDVLGEVNINLDFIVESTGEYSFTYYLEPEIFDDECMESICFDCVYDLSIRLTTIDECGDLVVVFDETHEINGLPVDGICDEPSTFNLTEPYLAAELTAGSYHLEKTLKVNEEAREEYLCMYLENSTCLMSYQDFFNASLAEISFDDCEDDALFLSEDLSYCEGFKQVLLLDVSPYGQYGLFDWVDDVAVPSGYPLSVFNTSNSLPVSGAHYQNPVGDYKDEDGTVSTVIIDGDIFAPESLTVTQFINNWRDSWAEALLPYHPEYSYLVFCEDNSASHDYDASMLEESTFEGACTAGFFDPLGISITTSFPSIDTIFDGCDAAGVSDDFFIGVPGSAYLPQMEDKMESYVTIGAYDLSIWDLAVLMVLDPDASTSNEVWGALNGNIDPCYLTDIWIMYRKLYLTAKMNFYKQAELDYVMEYESYNGCIGEATFDETINDFACYDLFKSPNCVSPSTYYHGYGDVNQACYSGTYALYAGKTRRFSVYDEDMLDVYTPGELDDIEDEAEAYILDLCTESCTDNANYWIAQLTGCGLTVGEEEDIRDELIELCILGCDFEHPFGASTAPAGEQTALGNTSFYEVLEYFLGPGFETEVCSDLLITTPRPYGQGPTLEYTGILDNCGCDLILQAESDFIDFPELYESGADAFNANNGFYLENYEELKCKCENALSVEWDPESNWISTDITNLLAEEIIVPNALTCTECPDCDEMAIYVSDFHTRFSGVVDFEDQPTYENLLGTYLNNLLGYHLIPSDYLEFMSFCESSSEDKYCVENPQLYSFFPTLDLLIKEGKFLTSSLSPIDLITESIPYEFSQFAEGMSNHDYWTDFGPSTCSSGELELSIGDVSENCSMKLYLPEGADFCFEDIIGIVDIMSLTDDCGDNYDFRLEVAYVNCNGIGIATLEGESDCYTSLICNCGLGDDFLCDEYNDLTAYYSQDCYSYWIEVATSNATDAFQEYMAQEKAAFRKAYTEKCMTAFESELFTMTGVKNEYQYTLFYYDQAGNLVRTVPPKGVKESILSMTNDAGDIVPVYEYDTDYRYNTYNQITNSNTPDGGLTNFWYDRYGRIIASQNAEQAPLTYSYILYDEHGRAIESGITEKGIGEEITELIAKNTDPIVFENWVINGTQTEITKTYYDEPMRAGMDALFKSGGQKNLRLRIASVAYYETEVSGYENDYTSAIHYSYDVHGNVVENVQDVPLMKPVEQDIKSTQYDFSLHSGNVTEVTYQEGEPDQFIHQYEYDQLNRLHEVYSSANDIDYDLESKQFYFDHGPLSRIEIGEDKVQGLDYTYTLNGWLKGTNSATLTRENDLGLDGITAITGNYAGNHAHIARDVFGFTLGYYEGDYQSIGTASFEATTASTPLGTAAADLFNGNIRYMTTAIEGFDIQGTAYTYDQLQRFKLMEVYRGVNVSGNTWGTSAYTADYRTEVYYDENGNITFLDRNGYGTELDMDRFTYDYIAGTNKLDRVNDAGTDYAGYEDIKTGMASGNYDYDAIGRLIEDTEENIGSIDWRFSDNKVKKINRLTTDGDDLEFIYNPLGMRIVKIVKPDLAVPAGWEYTYYTYDAGGNVMATYNSYLQESTYKETTLNDHHIYGGKRLGVAHANKTLYDGTLIAFTPDEITQNKRGEKTYEFSNHLGNVLATTSDRVKWYGVKSGPSDDEYGYHAYVQSKTDYYPFGMVMPDRNETSGGYRYGFQGQEIDDEIKGNGNSVNYKYRMHDPRIGRFFAVDPLAPEYPHNSPYAFSENKLIAWRELEGLESYYSAGAGHDADNTGYIDNTVNAFELQGIKEVVDIEAHGCSSCDAIWAIGTNRSTPYYDQTETVRIIGGDPTISAGTYSTRQREPNWRITQTVDKIKADQIKRGSNDDNLQLNLMGYSTGSVIMAQSALMLTADGFYVDNLVLIGSPILEESQLFQDLMNNENIGNIIVVDIKHDNVKKGSESSASFVIQGDDHPHFAFAFHKGTEYNLNQLVEALKAMGIGDNKTDDSSSSAGATTIINVAFVKKKK